MIHVLRSKPRAGGHEMRRAHQIPPRVLASTSNKTMTQLDDLISEIDLSKAREHVRDIITGDAKVKKERLSAHCSHWRKTTVAMQQRIHEVENQISVMHRDQLSDQSMLRTITFALDQSLSS